MRTHGCLFGVDMLMHGALSCWLTVLCGRSPAMTGGLAAQAPESVELPICL
jgi:hypothetical protein